MYIDKISFHRIRNIEKFEMKFEHHAGWHVIIGDNGSGKSTIVRGISLALLNIEDMYISKPVWDDWIFKPNKDGTIILDLIRDEQFDFDDDGKKIITQNKIGLIHETNEIPVVPSNISNTEEYDDANPLKKLTINSVTVGAVYLDEVVFGGRTELKRNSSKTTRFGFGTRTGSWFSASYGANRKLVGDNTDFDRLYKTNPRLSAHISALKDDIPLTEALSYLRDIYTRELENYYNNRIGIVKTEYFIKFINKSKLLPNNIELSAINLNGVFFTDTNKNAIKIENLSDGYRSILSLAFDLIRQLITFYDFEQVFARVASDIMVIDLPGVVLIDEIDTHLHPKWQVEIGNWFVTHFPNIQFIVTTHSPLICRASEHGTIWRITSPGSDEPSGQVTGIDRERLIFGNVLDAYGTELFGEDLTQSKKGLELGDRLAELNKKSFKGIINEDERRELYELRAKMPTVE